MAGRVDQVENIVFTVICSIIQAHRLCLDGDTTLALKIHLVEELIGLFAIGKSPGHLEKTVCQG